MKIQNLIQFEENFFQLYQFQIDTLFDFYKKTMRLSDQNDLVSDQLSKQHSIVNDNKKLSKKINNSQKQCESQQFAKLTIYSQAYPKINAPQKLKNQADSIQINDQYLNKHKNVLKPEVNSQVHAKLKKINFCAEEHTQPILIRQFQLQDLMQLKKLQQQWFPIRYGEEFYKKVVTNQVYCLIAETVITISNCLAENCQQQKQKQKQKIIVGAAVFEIKDSEGYAAKSWIKSFVNIFLQSQDSLYIMTFGVIDQFRKKGIGKLLLNQIIQVTKQYLNIKLIYLHVISYNQAAIKFYKRIGFDQIELLKQFYHVGGKPYDGQVYGMFVNDGKLNTSWSLWLKKWLR